jgi:hypothetical protein
MSTPAEYVDNGRAVVLGPSVGPFAVFMERSVLCGCKFVDDERVGSARFQFCIRPLGSDLACPVHGQRQEPVE